MQTELSKETPLDTVDSDSESSDSNSEFESESHSEVNIMEKDKSVEKVGWGDSNRKNKCRR